MPSSLDQKTVVGQGPPRVEQRPVAYVTLEGYQPPWLRPKCFVLAGDLARIGRVRGPDAANRMNDFVVDEMSVSRFHAVFERADGQWTCRDDGSQEGTSVNGARLDSPKPIRAGDEILLGRSVRLRCRDDEGLLDDLVEELPSPLARLESVFRTKARASQRIQALFLTVDRALRFLAAVFLATLRRAAASDEERRRALAAVLQLPDFGIASGRKLTMGAWRALTLKLVEQLAKDNAVQPIARAARALSAEMPWIAEAVAKRNDWAHEHVPNEDDLEAEERTLQKLVARLLKGLAPLAWLRLITVVESENLVEGYRYKVLALRGDAPARIETMEHQAKLLPRWCYLISPDDPEPLLLAPMVAASNTSTGDAEVFLAPRLVLGTRDAVVELLAGASSTAMKIPLPWYPEMQILSEAVSPRGP
jgi:hypothetical protein